MNTNRHALIASCVYAYLAALSCPTAMAAEDTLPNIIIMMTDDMGFSDLGCYGSEINTPHLDQLASRGLRFTQFYNCGKCCPTRASLLTGLYSHQAGMGSMTRDEGPENPGYRGRLMEHTATIAEVLSAAGYLTIQTGKWHVGDKKKEWWPLGRGFHRTFSSPAGGGFYFRPSGFRLPRFVVRNHDVIYDMQRDPPADWYTTDAYTEEGLAFVREAVAAGQPFFWYCAYNAPHYPLKAKPADIAKYRHRYQVGWDVVRRQRYARLIELGVIDKNWELSSRATRVPAWDTLTEQEQDVQDLRMATYAAMIDRIDQNVGKVFKTLGDLGVENDTLFLFLHDNGGCQEGGVLGANKGNGECGTVDSEAYYGECWANVSNTPFRRYKSHVHEGGIATPLIAHWPSGIDAGLSGALATDTTHVFDLMATCIDVAAAAYPTSLKGHAILPMSGTSLRPVFQGQELQRSEPLCFEFNGNRGIRDGDWKLVSAKGKAWELYNMRSDRTEQHDLSAQYPQLVTRLAERYGAWAKRSFVGKTKNRKTQ